MRQRKRTPKRKSKPKETLVAVVNRMHKECMVNAAESKSGFGESYMRGAFKVHFGQNDPLVVRALNVWNKKYGTVSQPKRKPRQRKRRQRRRIA